jgi:nucleotide-binding universal stress UspA family protein
MSRSIVVGADGSPATRHALSWAAEFNRDLSLASFTTWRRQLRDELEHVWIQPLRDKGVPFRTDLVEAETVEAGLPGVAAIDDAGLIVLGADGNGEIKDRLLGSLIARITHRAPCPVVVPTPASRQGS